MRTRRLLMGLALGSTALGVAFGAAAQPPAPAPPAVQSPPTEIYLSPMKFGPNGPLVGPARNVTDNPGRYDNQPFFGSDGRTMLFASNRDGAQTDIYFLELQTRQMRQFTRTAESEYSPTVMPDDAGVSAIRVEADGTQRLWKFGEGGRDAAVVLPNVTPAGYHAWIDAGRVAVYVLGTPATLQIVEVASGRAEIVARDIGRSLLRRPTGTVSFVVREGDGWMVKEYDPASGQIRPLVAALDGSPDRDAAWGPDGTLFMARGHEVFAWRPGAADFRLAGDPGVGPISRMAVSRDGRWMALVVAEGQN
ncbi:MAG: TolB family protein [Vicinamibacterales bacterium]